MHRDLAVAASVAALLNLLAGFGTLVLLAGGTPLEPDAAQRAAFVAAHPFTWAIGWSLWLVAALSLVVFYAVLVPPGRLGRMAVVVASVGFIVDLVAGSGILAFVLPRLAGDIRGTVEVWAFAAAGVVANGLYTIGGVTAVAAAWRARSLDGWLALASVPLWSAGLGLSGATAAGNDRWAVVFGAAVGVLAVTWLTVVGVVAWRASS